MSVRESRVAPGDLAPAARDERVERDAAVLAGQLRREPRSPWRAAARCRFSRPTVIVSPARLADGTPFPTYAWLTCPHLLDQLAGAESAGEIAAYARRAHDEPGLAAKLIALDARLRELRAQESGGPDPFGEVGIGGQSDPLGVKCLHVHVALALLGEDDPIGNELLERLCLECDDDRCARLAGVGVLEEGR